MAKMTRRRYLTFKAIIGGAPSLLVSEAVSSVAIEHPEWDMEELDTWEGWEARGKRTTAEVDEDDEVPGDVLAGPAG